MLCDEIKSHSLNLINNRILWIIERHHRFEDRLTVLCHRERKRDLDSLPISLNPYLFRRGPDRSPPDAWYIKHASSIQETYMWREVSPHRQTDIFTWKRKTHTHVIEKHRWSRFYKSHTIHRERKRVSIFNILKVFSSYFILPSTLF